MGAECQSTYIVKAGDSLGSIAAAHKTTVQVLLAANPSITDPDKIWVGQKLCIPAPSDPRKSLHFDLWISPQSVQSCRIAEEKDHQCSVLQLFRSIFRTDFVALPK